MKPSLLWFAATTVLCTLHLAAQLKPAPEGSAARAWELIDTLHLSVLPRESGYLGLIGQFAQTVPVQGRQLAVRSQV